MEQIRFRFRFDKHFNGTKDQKWNKANFLFLLFSIVINNLVHTEVNINKHHIHLKISY